MIKVNYENSPSRDVPTDPTNTDYMDLQAWVAEGNTIEAAD